MEVIVHSTLSTIGGQVTVATDPNQSIDSLITAFCVEKGIPHRQDYVLRNRDQEILEATGSLSAGRVLNGDILFLSLQGKHYSVLFCYLLVVCFHQLQNCIKYGSNAVLC
jgi:hypothetical protein